MRKYFMIKLLLTLLGATLTIAIQAQSVLEEIRQNITLASSNYMAYPGPKQKKLTPAPKGMKPFYISHYGRHGSRYHSKPSLYDAPYLVLHHADSLGKLTPLGKEVMMQLERVCKDADNHWGDLTPLGEFQQEQIAKRMVERFPEVFRGRANVEARSTGVSRCVLSMEHALIQLTRMNPQLNISMEATHRDMSFLNQQDKKLFLMKKNTASTDLYNQYLKRYKVSDRLTYSFFNDSAYVHQYVDVTDFDMSLMLVAAILPNMELGKQIDLYHLFTPEEAYEIWKIGNVYWYIGWGASAIHNGLQPYTQRNLLRKLINDADSCIQQPNTNVQLRFGHETVLLPLVCLLNINGYGIQLSNLDLLEEKGWVNYRIFPMASNVQFIFYRKNPNDRDVLFKVLLNENEATLPLPSEQAPYYKWSDFKNYYLKKLDAYQE